jgi:Uma2 family endonuclease
VRTFVCEDALMATHAAHQTPTYSSLPLYRMESGLYERLLDAGALDGLDMELRDGLLLDREQRRGGSLHRFDTDTYNRMVAMGALEDLPLELLGGLLVEMSQQGPRHSQAIVRLTRHLAQARAWLGVQLPLEIKPDSEPEPDLALIEAEPSWVHHPRTALLTVEVAVTSHSKDRNTKGPIYARNGVPTYWLIDVPGRAVEVRSEPGPRGYGRCEVYGVGAQVPSPAEGVPALDVAWLFDSLRD